MALDCTTYGSILASTWILARFGVSPWSSVPDIFRRGVWLGRHIFYKTTKVSKDKLSENRNLT